MRESKSPGPASSVPRGKNSPAGCFWGAGDSARAEVDVAGVVGVGCCLRLAEGLTEACGPDMPGPYGELKEIGAPAG